MVAVLDNLGLDAVHVCGMSMGGFVAVELATAFPGRVKSLILVDGGFPMAAPPGLTPETLPAVFRDLLARLDRELASVREYAEFLSPQPRHCWTRPTRCCSTTSPTTCTGRGSGSSADALIADAADIFFGSSKWRQLQVPARLLTAEWSTGADTAPAYPAEAVQAFRDALDVLVTVRPMPGADHAASIMTMTGARATADLIAEALAPETLA